MSENKLPPRTKAISIDMSEHEEYLQELQAVKDYLAEIIDHGTQENIFEDCKLDLGQQDMDIVIHSLFDESGKDLKSSIGKSIYNSGEFQVLNTPAVYQNVKFDEKEGIDERGKVIGNMTFAQQATQAAPDYDADAIIGNTPRKLTATTSAETPSLTSLHNQTLTRLHPSITSGQHNVRAEQTENEDSETRVTELKAESQDANMVRSQVKRTSYTRTVTSYFKVDGSVEQIIEDKNTSEEIDTYRLDNGNLEAVSTLNTQTKTTKYATEDKVATLKAANSSKQVPTLEAEKGELNQLAVSNKLPAALAPSGSLTKTQAYLGSASTPTNKVAAGPAEEQYYLDVEHYLAKQQEETSELNPHSAINTYVSAQQTIGSSVTDVAKTPVANLPAAKTDLAAESFAELFSQTAFAGGAGKEVTATARDTSYTSPAHQEYMSKGNRQVLEQFKKEVAQQAKEEKAARESQALAYNGFGDLLDKFDSIATTSSNKVTSSKTAKMFPPSGGKKTVKNKIEKWQGYDEEVEAQELAQAVDQANDFASMFEAKTTNTVQTPSSQAINLSKTATHYVERDDSFARAFADIKPLKDNSKGASLEQEKHRTELEQKARVGLKTAKEILEQKLAEEDFQAVAHDSKVVFSDINMRFSPQNYENARYAAEDLDPDVVHAFFNNLLPIDREVDLHGETIESLKAIIPAVVKDCWRDNSFVIRFISGHGKEVIKHQLPNLLIQYERVAAFYPNKENNGLGRTNGFIVLLRNYDKEVAASYSYKHK